jgi:hypothetical protein
MTALPTWPMQALVAFQHCSTCNSNLLADSLSILPRFTLFCVLQLIEVIDFNASPRKGGIFS